MAEFAPRQRQEKATREHAPHAEAQRSTNLPTVPHNLALQSLYAAGVVRAKLAVGGADDPEEAEADRMADAAMAGKPVGCSCGPGEPPCSKCHAASQGAIRRKSRGHESATSVTGLSLGHERRLGDSDRTYFEARYRTDLSTVRIHDNQQAAASAAQLNARAFSLGSRIAFGAGEYRPHSSDGRRLLAHELAHVVQGHTNLGIRRQPLDASSTQLWGEFGTASSRRNMPDIFERLLGAAPQYSLAIEKKVKDTGKPKTDAEREVLKRRLEALVRVNALGMMAAHKASIEHRRDITLGTERTDDTKSGVQSQHDTAENVRNALGQVRKLNRTRGELKDFSHNLDWVRADSIKSLTFPVEDWFKAIADNSWRYITPERRQYLRAVATSVGQIKDRDRMRLLVYFTAQSQQKWRERQIEGIDAAVQALYKAYPFLTQWEDFISMPDFVVLSHDDNQVMKNIVDAYRALLVKVDGAIVRIGSGDIEAFDLPEPTKITHDNLPADLKDEMDAMLKEREVNKFRNQLLIGGAQLALVFIPVIGPALAAAVGVATLAMDLDDMLDRAAISGASDNPEGTLLGVSGPKDYEWAMLAVQAALTIYDLGALAKEMKLGTTVEHAAEDLHPHAGSGETPTPHAGTGEAKAPHPGADTGLEPHLASDQEFLNSTKNKPALSGSDVDKELEIAQSRGTRRPPTEPGTLEEIVTPGDHGHVWRKSESGAWCRSSPTKVCYIGAGNRDKSLAPAGYKLEKVVGKNIPDLVPDTVVEFPGGQRAWRVKGDPSTVVEESKLAPGVQRQGYEKTLPRRGEMGPGLAQSDSQLAHGQGAGTGFEGPYGIRRTPAEVNQALENTGIELYLRELERTKPAGLEYHYITSSKAEPGGLSLKERTYRVDATMNGRRRSLFDVKIEVSHSGPTPTAKITEVWINPDPDVAQVLSMHELPHTIPERLRFIFSRGASFPAAPVPK